MLTEPLKEAMLKYAPILTEDYKKFVKNQWKEMVADLGNELKGVYNSWKWSNTFQSIKTNLRQAIINEKDVVNKYKWELDSQKLKVNSVRYGERVALEWYHKMIAKLVNITDVQVSEPNAGGFISITGKNREHKVYIEQNRIINASKYGTLFHQFPARIYIDGKFYSEANYKKMIKGG